MTEITLSDYVGYIFREIIKAREMADAYSRQVAEEYAKDEVMRHFSVPRFKAPNMDLTIPVLISGARFRQTIRFKMDLEKEFRPFIQGRIADAIAAVKIGKGGLLKPDARPVGAPGLPSKASATAPTIEGQILDFHKRLAENPDPSQPDTIVTLMWAGILKTALTDNKLMADYEKSNPNDELLKKTTASVLGVVKTNTVIERTTIENLLINPETNVVKNGSSDASVFTIKANML